MGVCATMKRETEGGIRMKNYVLVSSNENKLKEFKRLGLENVEIEKGKDLPEVDSDPITVILYKSLAAGAGRIVEDTSLFVEEMDIGTNIRWLMNSLQDSVNRKASWEVYLGVNDGESITVYKGVTKGIITDTYTEHIGFGFDCYFQPEGYNETLYDLEEKGEKDAVSARKKAIEHLLQQGPIMTKAIGDIPEWNGSYQK